MSSSNTSGLLKGGGIRGAKRRRSVIEQHSLRHMPDVHITDIHAVKTEVWDYDPRWEFEYSPRELLLMAEKILLLDPKPHDADPYWLNAEQLRRRQKREIYTANGTPDPSYVSGMYWRTHPQGRKVNTDEQRKQHRAGFYHD